MEDEHIYISHNKTLLLYHLVFPSKYEKKVFIKEVEETLKEVCIGISERYEIQFIEIGNDLDHIHFLVQSVPTMTVSQIAMMIKSITAKEIFKKHKKVKKILWGGNPLDKWILCKYSRTICQ